MEGIYVAQIEAEETCGMRRIRQQWKETQLFGVSTTKDRIAGTRSDSCKVAIFSNFIVA
jgi:hypothetical protein